jgi:hypothetical protein
MTKRKHSRDKTRGRIHDLRGFRLLIGVIGGQRAHATMMRLIYSDRVRLFFFARVATRRCSSRPIAIDINNDDLTRSHIPFIAL